MIMSPSPMHDLPAPLIDGAHHRKEAASKSKEIKPLFSTEPLPHDREKRPAVQTHKKRKRIIPSTPALTFDPKRNHVPSGRQDPPLFPPFLPRPPASESSTSPYDEPQTTPFDREIHDQFYNGYDVQKRPRIFSECSSTEHSTSSYPNTPCTDMSSVPAEFHDSPVSYASSSSSDQSPCAVEFAVVIDCAHQLQPMYPYDGQYVQQPMVHPDSYGYPMGSCPDSPAQGYHPDQYSDAAHGRPASHGMPAYPYPENNDYSHPPHKY